MGSNNQSDYHTRHSLKHYPIIMPYRCPKCVNTFKTIHLYNRHAASATDCGVEQIVIARPQDRGTSTQSQVKKEYEPVKMKREMDSPSTKKMKYDNNDVVPVRADGSEIKQEVKYSSRSHVTYPSIMRPVKFPCNKCNERFDTRSQLEDHERSQHEEKRCEECEDDFSWPEAGHDCYYTRYQLRNLRGDIVPAF